MIYRQGYKGGVWVDLESPTDEEIREVAREFSLSERIETELLSPTPFPLVSGDGGAAFAVLHFPSHATEHNEEVGSDTRSQEVDFIVNRRAIITVRYEVVAPLHHLRRLLESEEIVSGTEVTADTLIELLFAHLYAAARDHTHHISGHLEHIERDIFEGRSKNAVRAISLVDRAYLHLEAALASQEEPLDRFLMALCRQEFFGAGFGERAERIRSERAQVERLVGAHLALAVELREANSALLNATQNEVMKTLTVINVIFLPLGLIASVFAMRTNDLPFLNSPNGFWIILVIMGIATLLLTAVFAKKRWLF